MTVSELEAALFAAFPRTDAEPWDHVGRSIGDPEAVVGEVLVALDATEATVRAAADAGANVLLAHHPVYLSAPAAFGPCAGRETPQAAAAIYQAARSGVSIISMHTNLDRSRAAREALMSRLALTPSGSLEHPDDPEAPGLGGIADHAPLTLSDLADRAAAAFDAPPRIWGSPRAQITRTAVLGGSLSDLGERALAAGAQAIVCGEAGYHVCQDLAARGCGVILLGHDASELPFCSILRDHAVRAGVEPRKIRIMNQHRSWWVPGERD